MTATLTFDQFTRLLSKVGNYTALRSKIGKFGGGFIARMQSLAPSKRCDILARIIFPVVVALMITILYLLLPLY